ncbi:NAD-dependent succinate-semialdehyde dehydrogenase [Microbacterium sp. MYb62]|uniref:NAD-dependent succinate-semialdehyde dehydrogenase n=1 Tax=Microbacterium sp. MYb62 TaxID=1848690 RepID=UPI000CFBD9DA|nr:NAD-dependent succinate-semialdehyde dehydrogenase [Microbacterium sp. MYb62]PRB16571.1 NAD-dependent succinate-semialdehyde dehydrogenase [Microbacterium sp. MYb62]
MTTVLTPPVVTDLRGHAVPVDHYIGGTWVADSDRFAVFDPATGRQIAEVADADESRALEALDAAVDAQQTWRGLPPRRRADLFARAHRILRERADMISEIMTLESGKPLAEARAEFALSADFFLWYSEQIAHLHGSFAEASQGGYRIITSHEPVGPTLLITPWNFPLLMIARKAGAALAAGCTAVVKSARETPLTCALFVQVLHDAGFPPGVVNLVHTTSSARLSAAVMGDPRLRKVSFTGSTEVGTTLLRQAAPGIVNAAMELGGDGPLVVLHDADIELAASQAVIAKFRNAGQACVAANRIIVDERIADAFIERFVALTKALHVGSGFDPATDVGPIISATQREGVAALVAAFEEIDATRLTGGGIIEGEGYFFEPTVYEVHDRDNELCHRELFAPIATIYRVADTAEAITFANDTRYGLAAYVFTRDLSRAFTVGERLEFGMVGVNRGIMADPAAPFGGTKASGLGREGGQHGICEFLEPKYLAVTVDEEGALA